MIYMDSFWNLVEYFQSNLKKCEIHLHIHIHVYSLVHKYVTCKCMQIYIYVVQYKTPFIVAKLLNK